MVYSTRQLFHLSFPFFFEGGGREYFNNAEKYLTRSPNALHLRDTAD